MNGNSDWPAGLEPADACDADDHASGHGNRARDRIAQAYEALEGCSRQEAQEARRILLLALAEEAERDLSPG